MLDLSTGGFSFLFGLGELLFVGILFQGDLQRISQHRLLDHDLCCCMVLAL